MPTLIEQNTPRLVVIRVDNRLDFTSASEFKRICLEVVQDGTHHFILDFSRTEFIDSTGLGVIFSLAKVLSPVGGSIVFAAPTQQVAMTIRLLQLHRLFQQYPSVHAALGGLILEEAC